MHKMLRSSSSFVHERPRMQRAHACMKPQLAAAITCLGCLVSYRPLAAAFVYSSKIPSMRCVTSRCVALTAAIPQVSRAAALGDEPRAPRATRAMIV